MSIRCPKCFRPEHYCLCKYTKELDSGVKFVFLMHPKEYRKQRTGTGRLAKISLKDSEILVGIDFSENLRLKTLLSDKKYYPVLLYPGKDALTVKNKEFKSELKGKILLAIIIDATWFCSKKVIQNSQFLLNLPKITFANEYHSIFTFKKEPMPECVSTIETCYYLIKELQEIDAANRFVDPEPLMNVFKQMIKDQLQAENDRIAGILPNTHPKDWKYTKPKEIPDFK